MKNKITFLVIAVFIFSFMVSCINDDADTCLSRRTEFVTSVNSPTTGTINEPVIMEVEFGVINGCGEFDKFIQTQNGEVTVVQVEAKYEGCVCTQDAPTRTVNYEFTPTQAGNYEFKFISSPTEFITVNISIE